MSSNTNIGNTPVNQGYVQLIHMGETGGIDGTLRALYDGDGTASDLLIASDKVKISTELFIGSKTLTEFVQDTVGAMFSSNTETNITVTYQDGDGTIDLVSSGEVTLTGSETLTNKTLTSPVINTGISGSAILDEDNMASNSATKLSTQQSIKAYVDAEVAGVVDTAPAALNTLNELAAALGDDANFATTTATSLGEKLVKSSNLSDLTNAGTARSNLGVDAAGTDNSTNVTLAGSLDYITLSGQQITRNAIDLTADVTGVLPSANLDADTAHLSGTQTFSGAKTFSSSITLGGHAFDDIDIGSEFTDADDHIMSAGAIKEKIESYSYLTAAPVTALNNATANELVTVGSTTTELDAESTLTYDGTSLQLSDNKILSLGDSDDIKLYHNSSSGNANIENYTGSLYVTNYTDDGDIFFRVDDGGSNVITALQIDGSENGSVFMFNDNAVLGIGAGNDLRFWHDGTNSNIYNYVGNLNIGNATDDGDIILYSDDGSGGMTAYLTLDGSLGHSVINKNMRAVDSVKFTVGNADDASFYHDATDTYIENGTGNFYIRQLVDDGDLIFQCDNGSGGNATYLTLDGSVGYTQASVNMRFADNAKLQIGASADLELNHDGTDSTISNKTGDLYITNTLDDKDIFLRSDNGSGGVTSYLQLDGSTGHLNLTPPNNVGIGTSSPKTKLDIENSTAPTLSNDTHAGEAIFLRSGGSAGDGNVQAVLAFGKADGSSRRSGSAIASVQVDSDLDKVGIGFYTSDSSASSQTMDLRMLLNHTGNLHVDADVVAYSTSVSDERLKDNIETIPNALDKVMQLRGVEFDWNKGNRKGQKDLGLIAQEVEKVLPEIVREKKMAFIDNEIYKTIDYDKVVGVLIEAIKEQQEQIDELKGIING